MKEPKPNLPVVAPKDHPLQPVREAMAGPLAKFSLNLPGGWFFCTLPLTTKEELSYAIREIEMVTNRLWDARGSVLSVRDVAVVMSDEENEETGEVKLVKRLIVWTANGIGYQTPSKPARQSLARQLARYAQPPLNLLPPYDPPLQMSVDACRSVDPGKGDWLHLVIIPPGDKSRAQNPKV